VCPFIDMNDPRCSAHLTLDNLAQAMAHCANRYCDCRVYQQLVLENHADAEDPANIGAVAVG